MRDKILIHGETYVKESVKNSNSSWITKNSKNKTIFREGDRKNSYDKRSNRKFEFNSKF